ncbi:Scr1 family TA system antitoxin-like transcriptional regulator [Streptomyces sp. NPDC020766]|uniref:Scr1 family TA system antitoxin-like transcriptional regulator n=1 Tax=Streptomyces sp. NPDC020766 TaxID=3155011 RepID=UPI0033EC638B
MVLLESPDHERYAYEEGQVSSVLHTDSEAVSTLTQRFGMIRMQALSTGESARLIREVADQW